MVPIKKQFIINEEGRKVAVQIDLKTFLKIERLLEDYALGKLIEENDPEELLSLSEATSFYETLSKKD